MLYLIIILSILLSYFNFIKYLYLAIVVIFYTFVLIAV